MNRLDCLVVDDEPHAGQLLQDYIARVPLLRFAGNCFDGTEALERLTRQPVDLLFLDINMPGIGGIELAARLPKTVKLIFTTAYSEYAIESYEYNAIDYLLKPISFRRFSKSMAKLEALVAGAQSNAPTSLIASEGDDFMFVKSDKKMIRINYRDILYFEAVKEYIFIHTATEKILIYKRMKELAEKLPTGFLRVHNSYIVNCRSIARLEGNFLVIGQVNIPVGASYKEAFLDYISSKSL